MPWPRISEGEPLWERAVYTSSYGAHLSSVPSGDQSVNPATFGASGHSGLQRALLSAFAQKRRSSGRLTTSKEVSKAARSAVPFRSSASGHRASRSKYTRGQSRETGSLSRSSGGMGAPAKFILLGTALSRLWLCHSKSSKEMTV